MLSAYDPAIAQTQLVTETLRCGVKCTAPAVESSTHTCSAAFPLRRTEVPDLPESWESRFRHLASTSGWSVLENRERTHEVNMGRRHACRSMVLIGVFLGGYLACAPTADSASLVVTDFRMQPGEAQTMDAVAFSFILKNAGQRPVVLGKDNGVFVGARFVISVLKRENRDFGYQFQGRTLAPGESLSYKDSMIVDSAGEWRFFPVVESDGKFVTFEQQTQTLNTKKRPASSVVQASLAPGRTIVHHRGTAVSLQVFPPDNPWNRDISGLPVHPLSDQWLANIGKGTSLHPDFGSGTWKGAPIGIPFVVVGRGQQAYPADFHWAAESDRGPYPIPLDAPIEGGSGSDGDRHAIAVDVDGQKLYELYRAFPKAGGWKADCGAVFDLTTNELRPAGWTSADAAGLPIFAGLARYEEVYELGEINHALRFTAEKTQRGYISPARHFASTVDTDLRPPMGMRVRLKESFDISPFPEKTQVILRALKKYGMLLADNGGDWFISGAPHPGWRDRDIDPLRKIKGGQFEVVDTGQTVKSR